MVSEWGGGAVRKISLETAEVTTVADGLQLPRAVAVDGDHLFVVETAADRLNHIRLSTQEKTVISVTGDPIDYPLDMVACGDNLFLANYDDNNIIEIACTYDDQGAVSSAESTVILDGFDTPLGPFPRWIFNRAVYHLIHSRQGRQDRYIPGEYLFPGDCD